MQSDKLDAVDRALVERLRIDGRESNRALGEALGISEVAVANRLRRLEECSVMRVVAVTDMRIFGHRELSFALLRVSGRSPIEVAQAIEKLPDVVAVTAVIGRIDLVVPMLGRNHRHLAQLFGTTLPRVAGVDSVQGLLALDVLKFESKWGVLSADSGTAPDSYPSESVDELDLRILKRLQVDARRSFRGLASELGVSERTVRGRVKRLSVENVIRIQAVSDVNAFGMNANAYIGITATRGLTDEVGQNLIQRDDVAQLTRTLGEFDYIAVVIAPDRESLHRSVFGSIATIPGVRRAELFEAWANSKHNYAWGWLV
ncbi:Lrp/AsnC family transcriptional regulator [Mycobacterium sp. CVI_P3]|uniref:Lrp/AsnC family transcriptional regulator n=1 Tax=Mycobacterium pinniadriaticum TaxID=2994102 RepID=A0ABT3SD65_9MYCO|nr:Lrp/AsnC family transcriptional regulator [Mycobacterium pinniadriaticum]MCX2930665.1 Lrp/AsnC family transcriptional regulator [Mycobacterium pinniadriaticum]MCX2937089.1 Lrp/AsnC family transcriptional regulator [Mycobacterium pinniadriaticum]